MSMQSALTKYVKQEQKDGQTMKYKRLRRHEVAVTKGCRQDKNNQDIKGRGVGETGNSRRKCR